MRLRYDLKACYTAAEMLSRCGKTAAADPTGKSCIAFTPAKDHPDAAGFWLPSVSYASRTHTKGLKRQKANLYFAHIYFCTDARLVFRTVKQRELTTTNIWCPDNLGDRAKELLDNDIAFETTLGEAIARGILVASKYGIAGFCRPAAQPTRSGCLAAGSGSCWNRADPGSGLHCCILTDMDDGSRMLFGQIRNRKYGRCLRETGLGS